MASQRTLRRAVSAEDKQRRRQEILAAAKQVFAENGYHSTTVADVARGAGLSYGVVYWYFESKDDLFAALMTAEEEGLRSRIREALERVTTAEMGSLLRVGIRATFEYFEDNPASTRLLFRETSALGDRFERELSDIFGRFIGDLEALVVDAQHRGDLRDAPPRMVAYACGSLVGQIALRRQRADDGLSAREASDFLVDLLVEGLRPRDDHDTSPHRTNEETSRT